jgi:NADPH2:quinone reductase
VKAAVFYQPGGPDVLRYEDVPDPSVTPPDVLIKVEAISIEGGDTLHRASVEATGEPHVVGYQCAGTVLAAGEQVSQVQAGDRVVSAGLDGSHAQLRAVPEAFCWPIPAGLAVEEAACVPIPFGTADDALFEFGRLKAGEYALIQAGASGVGVAAIQLAKRAGARVLATASRDAKLDRLAALGLDHGINYQTTDTVAEVRKLTGGHGADVVIDSVGGPILRDSLRCLAYRGRCVSVGQAGRSPAGPLDISPMQGNNQTLTSYFLGAELITDSRARDRIAALLSDVASGALRVLIDRRYPLAEAAAAHAYVESRQAVGRVLLMP